MVADIAYLQHSQQQINQLENTFALQRSAFGANPMPSAEQRIQWLKALRELLVQQQDALSRRSPKTSATVPLTRLCSPS